MEENIIQKVINFALQNVWVLIIVIGFIFNFFKRLSGNVAEPTTPIPIPDPFKQFQQQEEEKESKHEVHQPVVVETQSVNEPINQYYERYLELQQKEEVKQEPKHEPKQVEYRKPAQTITTSSSKKVSKEKLVEGVIWSEILGPPRSKRPYYARRK